MSRRIFQAAQTAMFLAMLWPCAVVAEQARVKVDVIVLEHADLPALSAKDIDSTLELATVMIRKALDREVEMAIVERKAFDQFLAEQRARIKPYQLPSFDIFTDSLPVYRDGVIAACRQYGSLEQIASLLPAEERAKVKEYGHAADILLGKYAAAMEVVKQLKTKSGGLLVTRENRRDFSIVELDVICYSMELPARPTLYLSNTLIIDDNLRSPAPHTMLRGIAHGVAFPPSERAFVGYQGHLLGDARLAGYPWKLSDGGKRSAIAYTIAHEVGTHLLLKERDDYTPDVLVSRPMVVDEKTLHEASQWKPRKNPGKALNMTELHFGRHQMRLDVAIARKERKKAEQELEAVLLLEVPNDWIQHLVGKFERAKWD